MFQINDCVIHFREGLSTILAINNINGKDYFLLRPNHINGENIYVPLETAANIIRYPMTDKEATNLLKLMKGTKKDFNPNTKQRRDAYKKKLSSGKIEDIAYLYKQLFLYSRLGGENNNEIKLGLVDIEMLESAKKMLIDELSLTFEMDKTKVEEYINKKIK